MDTNYMESVWHIFKQLWEKGYVYRGHKILPHSTGLGTVLSNFEAGINYKEIKDPEIFVNFQSADDANVNYIVQCSMPWTLPSNLALCVDPASTYVKVEDNATKIQYIFAKTAISSIYPAAGIPYTVLDAFPGQQLKGKKYIPLFPYFNDFENAFEIITSSSLDPDSGTGIFHLAPAFSADDYHAAVIAGIIKRGGREPPCPVDESGRFTSPVAPLEGLYFKDAEKEIIQSLKGSGRVFRSGTITHCYPFCWRSNQPLIYKAASCWFVNVETAREKLMANNLKTSWVPELIQTRRFHNWIGYVSDWAVGRSRYWGTPLPIWTSDDFEEVVVAGSVAELEQWSGVRVADLHRESIDHITIPSRTGKAPLRRVEEVFDCWFESGSMPLAQLHYPFENREAFQASFPADFVAEGVDQTRGWFYTLLVLSTLLFDRPPCKNYIVHGVVLAKDTRKMSKTLNNYPDPALLVDRYGADALRMYLLNSPVVRGGESLAFNEKGVQGIIKEFLLPYLNTYRFFIKCVNKYETEQQRKFQPDLPGITASSILDKWILASAQSLVKFISTEMEAYRLHSVPPRLLNFIEKLSSWYVRLQRNRLKSSSPDSLSSLNILFEVLLTTAKAMAPFIPFFTEHLYQNLRKYLPEGSEESVHCCAFPVPRLEAVDDDIEQSICLLQSVIQLGRREREKRNIAFSQPLNEIFLVLKFPADEKKLEPVMDILYEELHVKNISFPKDIHLVDVDDQLSFFLEVGKN